MFSIFTLPTSTELIASVSNYGSPWFAELLPAIYLVLGISAVALIIVYGVKKPLLRGFSMVVGKMRRGGRRGRR